MVFETHDIIASADNQEHVLITFRFLARNGILRLQNLIIMVKGEQSERRKTEVGIVTNTSVLNMPWLIPGETTPTTYLYFAFAHKAFYGISGGLDHSLWAINWKGEASLEQLLAIFQIVPEVHQRLQCCCLSLPGR